ncbi:hypothetical protein [Streptomyces sp. NBC_00582]|nr:hypothetical protein [Streptomyces sp. NBC_00582]WUB59293.1 hypothetical protein OG852_02125 [Streptomyces sp. NBC_00582]
MGPPETFRRMLTLMLEPFLLTRAALPYMKAGMANGGSFTLDGGWSAR